MAYQKLKALLATLIFACSACLLGDLAPARAEPQTSTSLHMSKTLHFASNGNFDAHGTFLPARVGFDLADVSNRSELDRLPEGVKGLVWIGSCNGVDARFQAAVNAIVSHPKVFGFYLMDDPDPTGRWHRPCSASALKAESDWIHERRPDAITFVALMNLSSSSAPSFGGWYTPETTHVDLFGIAPYPCRDEWRTCDFGMIRRFVTSAVASGIPISKLVPMYQTFGFGAWRTDTGGRYRLPSPEEMRTIHRRWSQLVPAPVFDFAYSWGTQREDLALESSTGLQHVFEMWNSGTLFPRGQ